MSQLGVSLVLFHSSLPALERCLDSLRGQTEPLLAVYVHVNEAESGYVDAVRTLAAGLDVVLVEEAGNAGFAGAHDQGLDHLFAIGCSAAVVLNPDVQLQPSALAVLRRFADAHPEALAGPVLLRADPVTFAADRTVDSLGIRWTRDGRHFDVGHGEPAVDLPDRPLLVRGLTGACLLVPRCAHGHIVARTGEFFDPLFVAYREDAELALRAERIGVPMYLVPDAVGLHVRNVRGASRRNPVANRLGVQNRFLIAFKHGRRRPGGAIAAPLRDLVVAVAVLTVERDSLPGLRQAWRLRRQMKDKGRLLP